MQIDLTRNILPMSEWHKEETYKSLIQIGTSALRFVLLSNGGAAVALLAFLGKLHEPGASAPNVSSSLAWFLAGIVAGGVAHVTAYLTQLALYNEDLKSQPEENFKGHRTWLYLSLLLVVLGIVCFGVGAWCGVSSLGG